jgi:hypothetical protein
MARAEVTRVQERIPAAPIATAPLGLCGLLPLVFCLLVHRPWSIVHRPPSKVPNARHSVVSTSLCLHHVEASVIRLAELSPGLEPMEVVGRCR